MPTRRQMLAALLPVLSMQGPNRLQVGEAVLEVSFGPGPWDASPEDLLQWVRKAAMAVARYYQHFPVALARVVIEPAAGRSGVFHGTTWGTDPPTTRIFVGQHTDLDQLNRDWMMTHELVHLAFPDVAEEHHWIEEGIATYVEPIARVLTGELTPASVWGDMLKSMPLGQPGILDRGLDRTHTWGRTYWGGALFCLLADVRIRQATRNQKGLRDGLQAIVKGGGTIDHSWEVTRAFSLADEGTHTHVLAKLYAEMADRAVPVDLVSLWKELGVQDAGGRILFDDGAPLAAIRRSMLSPE